MLLSIVVASYLVYMLVGALIGAAISMELEESLKNHVYAFPKGKEYIEDAIIAYSIIVFWLPIVICAFIPEKKG